MKKKVCFRVALGGIVCAVCLMAMFCSGFLPMLDYAIPTFAGFLMVVMTVEVNSRWALCTYAAVSILCPLITPNYQAALLFIIFMGYYPVLKFSLDKMKNKALMWLIKFGVFNVAIILFYIIFQYIFLSEDMLDGMEMFGRYAVLVLWLGANVFFVIYEYALTQLIDIYTKWFRKKILRRK